VSINNAPLVFAILIAFLCVLFTGCGRQEKSLSVTTLRGVYKCTTQPPSPDFQLTNSFIIQFGDGSYVTRFYDTQSNLIAQSSSDWKHIAHWWKSSGASNAQDTAWTWDASATIFEIPPLSMAELMVVSSLSTVCPEVHGAFFNTMTNAIAFYYDYVPILIKTNYINGIQITDNYYADGRRSMRSYTTYRSVPQYSIFTNQLCRIFYSNYVNVGKTVFPRSIEIQDSRLIGFDCRYKVEMEFEKATAVTLSQLQLQLNANAMTNTYNIDRRITRRWNWQYTVKISALGVLTLFFLTICWCLRERK
jgi:hypothetical protein